MGSSLGFANAFLWSNEMEATVKSSQSKEICLGPMYSSLETVLTELKLYHPMYWGGTYDGGYLKLYHSMYWGGTSRNSLHPSSYSSPKSFLASISTYSEALGSNKNGK